MDNKSTESPDFWDRWIVVRAFEPGGFAETFLLSNLDDCSFAVLKWLCAPDFVEQENEIESYLLLRRLSLISTCEVLYNIQHPYRKQRIASKSLLLDYYQGPDLFDWLSSPNSNADQFVKQPEFLWSILQSCCEELGALHSAGITHGDVKPENLIFVSQNGYRHKPKEFNAAVHLPAKLKLIDFGFAQQSDEPLRGLFLGTLGYVPPEWLPCKRDMAKPVDQSIDVYALGSVMYTMMTAKPAYDQDPVDKEKYKIADLSKNFYPQDNKLEELVVSMLNLDSSKRPTIPEVLRLISRRG